MKNIKRIVAMVLALAILVIGASAAFADSSTLTTTGNVYMRMGPSKGYDTITALKTGVKVSVLDSEKDGRGVTWYKVTANGNTGWVSSVYLSSGENKIRMTGNSYLRDKASLDGKKVGSVTAGTVLKYSGTAKDGRGVTWYKVTVNNKTCWVSSKYTVKY